jgi:salicylate hydroxylase
MTPYAEEAYGGHPYLHIHRADYHKILVEEAERLGVKIQLNSVVTMVDMAKPSIHVKNRPEFKADIVLGGDGLKSICRETLLDRPDPPHLTGDLAYRIIVKAEDMKKHPLLKELAAKPAINYWMGPDAHAVCYLLKGGGLYNIVLACPDNLPEMVNMAKADVQEMREFFSEWDPQLRALLDLVQETSKWRLQNSEEMKVWSHPNGHFALLGDACHATLPYLAQGAAMAIEDGAVLGELFGRITRTSQLTDLLIIYEAIRKSRTTRVVKGSTFQRDIFHMHDGPRQAERDRQLLEHEPFEGYPNRWADPVFQKFLFSYDAKEEVESAWRKYLAGEFPMTSGGYRSNL